MTQSQGNKKDGWIYPTLSQSQNKQFFVWSDLDFNDTSTTRKLINEENVAVVHLKRTDSQSHYDHVPLDPKMLPDTPNQKYLLYCLGSSNQRTQEGINQMIIASFKLLNEIEKELSERKFQVWIVANPAAYNKPSLKKKSKYYQHHYRDSFFYDHFDKLNASINVFDWYKAIVKNTTEDFSTINYALHGFYNFQKLILFRILQNISGISILKPQIIDTTPMPSIKESFFLIFNATTESLVANATTNTNNSSKTKFKKFYAEQKNVYKEVYMNKTLKLPTNIILIDATGFTTDGKKLDDAFLENCISEKVLKRKIEFKVSDARNFNGDMTKLKNKLMDIKHDFISPILGIGTDKANFNIFYIFTEYSEQKLFHAIQIGRPKKDLFLKWIKNIADALIYLHGKNILHCGINTSNIAIFKDDIAKISDMSGILRRTSSNARTLPDYTMRDVPFAAPEIMEGLLCDSRIDVWGYSYVVLQLIVGSLTAEFHEYLIKSNQGPGVALAGTPSCNKQEPLFEVLNSLPQSLHTMLRAGLKWKRTDRVFMKDLVPLLNDVKNELDSMTEETWQNYARNNSVKKHVYDTLRTQNVFTDEFNQNNKTACLNERKFILEKLKKGGKHREKKLRNANDMEVRKKNANKELLRKNLEVQLADNKTQVDKIISTMPKLSDFDHMMHFTQMDTSLTEALSTLSNKITSIFETDDSETNESGSKYNRFQAAVTEQVHALPNILKGLNVDPAEVLSGLASRFANRKSDETPIKNIIADVFLSAFNTYQPDAKTNSTNAPELSRGGTNRDFSDLGASFATDDCDSEALPLKLDQNDGEDRITKHKILDERIFIMKSFEKAMRYREKKFKDASDKEERFADIKKQMKEIYNRLPDPEKVEV